MVQRHESHPVQQLSWMSSYIKRAYTEAKPDGGGDVQRASGRPQMAGAGGGGNGRLDLGGDSATEQAQEPPTVTCSGGVRLPSLGGGNRG